MPQTSRRPTPTARMIDLLAEEKRSLLRTGFPFDQQDDHATYDEAVQIDVRRGRMLAVLIDLRDENAPAERTEEAQDALGKLDDAFATILGRLPGMQVFEGAWDRSWQTMVVERAWPHATVERRTWRRVMLDCKPETRACFLGLPTPYMRLDQVLRRDLDERAGADPIAIGGRLVA